LIDDFVEREELLLKHAFGCPSEGFNESLCKPLKKFQHQTLKA